MFSHVHLGTADLARAVAFYDAILAPLGLVRKFVEADRGWAGWKRPGEDRPLLLVGVPLDRGAPHAPGHGQTVALLAPSRDAVDRCHTIALASGAANAGDPGPRPEYHEHYYGAYFLDPDGNKLCVCRHAPEPPSSERGPERGPGSREGHRIRAATADDLPAALGLLPRLADFEVPNGRAPGELWHGDRELVLAWAAGGRPDVAVTVAVDGADLLGVAGTSERAELLSGEPSVHLELLAVARHAEGRGVGAALLDAVDRAALAAGRRAVSLHVFAANARARALYARRGFDEELLRCFKRLA